ncbi:MAG: hypothetical protein Q9209_004163, partial [Squamulea sp. 1 TL-2023]
MSSYRKSPTGYSTPSFLNPRSPPPPPPPKSRSPPSPPQPLHLQRHQSSGPPLPPPPPTSTHPNLSQSTTPHQNPQSSHPQPPSPSETWLPPILLDKPTTTLQSTLQNPPLLTALSSTHPSLTPSPLPPHLHQTASLASTLQSRHRELLHLRQSTQSRLLHLRQLERQWRTKQSEIDRELEPWGAKNLYQRLVAREREGEEWTRGLEESFLHDDGGGMGGDGKVGEREVVEFLRR